MFGHPTRPRHSFVDGKIGMLLQNNSQIDEQHTLLGVVGKEVGFVGFKCYYYYYYYDLSRAVEELGKVVYLLMC